MSADLTNIETYVSALRGCLQQHPFLSVVLKKDTKKGDVYARASHVDLRQHFHLIDLPGEVAQTDSASVSEEALLARVIEHLCNDEMLTFFDTAGTIPGWRVDLLPLQVSEGRQRLFISFTFAHFIADGMSGVAFHKTLLAGMNESLRAGTRSESIVFETSEGKLAGLPHLPISPLYLLGPALGLYLPSFLSKALGLKPSVSGSDPGTWAGTKTFIGASGSIPPVTTAVEILSIDHQVLVATLSACRMHNSKLTSLLNELIGLCLSRHLSTHFPNFDEKTNLISATSINLRKAAGVSDTDMGIFASAGYTRHEIDHLSIEGNSINFDDAFWSVVSTASHNLAEDSSRLKNQPVGLLNWISNFDSWMQGQLGKSRDGSWQLSNLMNFDGKLGGGDRDDGVTVEKMFFCQPGHAVGEPLDFNIISTQGGELVICTGWQVGAIGLESRADGDIESAERELVRNVLRDLERHLLVLAEER